jgi:hypothetical protein
MMGRIVGTASEAELGGKRVAHKLAVYVAKAQHLARDPVKGRRLKQAAKQVKQFTHQLNGAIARQKVDPVVGAELSTLAGDAATELAGVITGG